MTRHTPLRLALAAIAAAATVGCAQQPTVARDEVPLLYQPALQRAQPTSLIPDSLRMAGSVTTPLRQG